MKEGGTEKTVSPSPPPPWMSGPPTQLIAIVGIVMLLLWFPSYTSYKTSFETGTLYLKMLLLLLLLPLCLIFVAHSVSKHGRLVVPAPPWKQHLLGQAGGSPWGVAAVLLLLLVLVSYHSNFKSMWSPLVWRSY